MTLSYTQGSTLTPLLEKTIGEAFEDTVQRYGNCLALVDRHQRLRFTWAELGQQVNDYARAMMALGINPGDRVGIWAPNCTEWCIAQFATAKIGAILVTINPAYRLEDLRYALKQSGCKWLICADKFKTSDYHQITLGLISTAATSEVGEINDENAPQLRGLISLSENPPAGFLSWSDLATRAEGVSYQALCEREASLDANDPINIQYTSGTTGFPKGATLSHRNILNNGYFVGQSLSLTEIDRLIIPVPLYHCFGMVLGNLACITHGSAMIYPGPGFDPEVTLQTVSDEGGTALYGVPTMFIAELAHPELDKFNLSTLRTGVMAGANCPVEVMTKVIEKMHMAEVQIAYGMTETSPISTQTGANDELERRISTVGRTQPHLETKIIDREGETVSRGEVGELCTRGYSVMLGYWENPSATAEAIDNNGWMHSDDLAVMDDEGFISIVGRAKDMIIRGGENISPREIEEFLYTHPGVEDAQVIGIPDKQYGEVVVAWIKLSSNATLDDKELRRYCQDNIAHYKVPKWFRFVEEFPMTVTGKIQKYRLREISEKSLAENGAA